MPYVCQDLRSGQASHCSLLIPDVDIEVCVFEFNMHHGPICQNRREEVAKGRLPFRGVESGSYE